MEKYGTARQAREDNTTHAHCTLGKATDIHSEQYYEILIAFPRQRCLRERSSMLRYTCLVNICQHLASRSVAARRTPKTGHISDGSAEEITEIRKPFWNDPLVDIYETYQIYTNKEHSIVNKCNSLTTNTLFGFIPENANTQARPVERSWRRSFRKWGNVTNLCVWSRQWGWRQYTRRNAYVMSNIFWQKRQRLLVYNTRNVKCQVGLEE